MSNGILGFPKWNNLLLQRQKNRPLPILNSRKNLVLHGIAAFPPVFPKWRTNELNRQRSRVKEMPARLTLSWLSEYHWTKIRAESVPVTFVSDEKAYLFSTTICADGRTMLRTGREKVGRWNEQSALRAMCDAEKDWHKRAFRASGAFGSQQNLPLNKLEISFSLFIFQPAVHYD